MEDKLATSVRVRYHAINDEGKAKYWADHYIVGQKHTTPVTNEIDMVTEIKVVYSWKPHVEVKFNEWGTLWLNDYVTEIHFESSLWKSLIEERRKAKKGESGSE